MQLKIKIMIIKKERQKHRILHYFHHIFPILILFIKKCTPLVATQKKYHHVARHKINSLTSPDETLIDEKNRVDFFPFF